MGKIKLLNNLTILAAAIRTTGTCKICLNTFTGECSSYLILATGKPEKAVQLALELADGHHVLFFRHVVARLSGTQRL